MANVSRYTRSVSIPISVAASRSWAVARITRPVWVNFMNANSATVSTTEMTKATTCERLNVVPPTRSATERCQGRTKRKSPLQLTSAMFWSRMERPNVVKIWTLCEAVMTPFMTRT